MRRPRQLTTDQAASTDPAANDLAGQRNPKLVLSSSRLELGQIGQWVHLYAT